MRHRDHRSILMTGLISALFAIGCGQAALLEKIAVSGKVTYNGEAIAEGEISFQPDGATRGPPSSATIKNGNYELVPEWGLTPGRYRVQVQAFRAPKESSELLSPGGLDRPKSVGIPFRDQYLPDKFHAKTTIETLKVASGRKKIEQNYDLKD